MLIVSKVVVETARALNLIHMSVVAYHQVEDRSTSRTRCLQPLPVLGLVRRHLRVKLARDGHQHRACQIAITFLILLIPSDLRPERQESQTRLSVHKNTLLRFSAVYVQSDSRVPIICAHIFALTPMSVRSYATTVVKHLLDNTIANVTRAFTQERKSSSAVVPSKKTASGAADVVSHAPMLLVVIFAAKLDACALNPCWKKRLSSVRTPKTRKTCSL